MCIRDSSHTALLDAVRSGDAREAAAEAGGFLDELLDSLGAQPEKPTSPGA